MRWKVATLFASCAVACACSAWAESPVTVSVESDTVQIGEPFAIRVSVAGTAIGDFTFPDVDGLEIDRTRIQQGSSFKIVGNKVSSIVTQVYIAYPTRLGAVQIPALAVEVGGKTEHSEPINLTVAEAGKPLPRTQPRRREAPRFTPGEATPQQSQQQQPQQDAPTWEDLVFIEAQVDKNEIYEGEAVTLTFSLWEIRLPGVEVGTPLGFRPAFPATQGFIAVPESPQDIQPELETRRSWNYQVNRWKQTLYPAASGELTIPAWQWESVAQALTSDGPRRKNYSLATDPITIKVKPLPERPANFSGAVGTFALNASLKRNEVIQGVPTELTIVIRGQGNPTTLGDIPLPKIEGAYVGDPKKESTVDPTTMEVQKTSVYSITPLEPGQIVIPELEFCFFDPATGTFQTLKKGPFPITVLKATQSERVFDDEGLGLGAQKITVLSEDIMPIITEAGSLRRHNGGIALPLALAVAPPAAYAALALVMMRRRRFAGDRGYARSHRAVKRVRAQLDALPKTDGAADVLYRALIGYVADKLDVSEAGLTSSDVQRFLEADGVDTELAENFLRILRRCERSRYASATLTSDEMGALTEGARTCIGKLDPLLKKERRS